MKSLELYNGLLDSLSLPRDENNQVLKLAGGDPIKIGKKVLVALSQEVLDTNEWEGKIAFHPLSEDILMGQSPIIHFLQRAVRVRLTNLVLTCMGDLMTLACSPELQAAAGDPDVAKYLDAGRNVKTSTVATWEKFMKRIRDAETGDDIPLKVYLSREASLADGTKYLRVATIGLPILEGKDDDDQMLWGIKFQSKKEKFAVAGLLETIIGDELSFGSNSCAPYFHALITAYVTIAKRIDKIQRSMKKVNKWKAMNFTWAKLLDDLESFEREIPPLEGNQGVLIKRKAGPVETGDDKDDSNEAEPVRQVAKLDALDVPVKDDADDVPWEKSSKSEPGKPRTVGMSLTDLLGSNKRDSRDDRRDRYDRDDRYDRRDRDYDRRDRRDRYDRDDRYDREDRRDRDYDRDDRSGRRGRGLGLGELMRLGRR